MITDEDRKKTHMLGCVSNAVKKGRIFHALYIYNFFFGCKVSKLNANWSFTVLKKQSIFRSFHLFIISAEVSTFFQASCVPGATRGSKLCELCKGDCSRSQKEPYYDYNGAFKSVKACHTWHFHCGRNCGHWGHFTCEVWNIFSVL